MSTLQLENIKHPDASGNALELASDGTLHALGNVGIGASDPTLYGDANTKLAVVVPTSNTNSVNALVGTNDVKGGVYINDVPSAHEVIVGTTQAYPAKLMSNGLHGVTVDTAGRVTMPYLPAFFATNAGSQYSNGATFIFSATNHNNGGHYSTSTGRFTAPVSGYYHFDFAAYVYDNSNTSIAVQINGSQVSNADVAPHIYKGNGATVGVQMTAAFSYDLQLNAGDWTSINARIGASYICNIYGGHTHWNGHLIG